MHEKFLIYIESEGGEFKTIVPQDDTHLDWWVASIHQNGWFEIRRNSYMRDSKYHETEHVPVWTFWVAEGNRSWPKKGLAAERIRKAQHV